MVGKARTARTIMVFRLCLRVFGVVLVRNFITMALVRFSGVPQKTTNLVHTL